MRPLHHIARLSLMMGMVLLTACNFPGALTDTTQQQPEAIYTSAALTMSAELTASSSEEQPVETPTGPAVVEPSQQPAPLDTSTPTPTSTPAPTLTPTPTIPLISASTNTNCRRGPSTLYAPPIGALAVGQQAEVHGRNDASTWWYISLPGRAGQFCWVWAETTDVEGNTTQLPVITPPPLPPTPTGTATPGVLFTAAYDNSHDCGSTRTAIFSVSNIGSVILHSMSLKIEDLTSSTTLYGPHTSDAPFMGTKNECPEGGDILPTGKTFYVGGAIGPGNTGHSARATIKLCTENGLSGTCEQVTVNFTIP